MSFPLPTNNSTAFCTVVKLLIPVDNIKLNLDSLHLYKKSVSVIFAEAIFKNGIFGKLPTRKAIDCISQGEQNHCTPFFLQYSSISWYCSKENSKASFCSLCVLPNGLSLG